MFTWKCIHVARSKDQKSSCLPKEHETVPSGEFLLVQVGEIPGANLELIPEAPHV